MCPTCRDEVTSGKHKCIRCGKEFSEDDSFVNPNFDIEKYNRLAGITNDEDENVEDKNNKDSIVEVID